ncbi:MarR family winged helix-turn-helix transcriptional regulator [Sphingomonas sp. Leaf357]|uniref:MarR family winged helix-turn-helix transcriptional regulator n=1 Tax=Sphingomonas sp. Leaf357 TaxID=1736350 RepID=UPI00191C5AF8|nr:MarR family transcriptional regulator [Sphingomonas sp. Leaf357]
MAIGKPRITRKDKPQATPFRFGFLVHDVSRLRRTLFDQEMKPLGVTRSQWSALAALSRHPDQGVTQVDLARLLEVGKVTIGGLIDRLEASGLIRRVPDKIDRRVKRVFITDKGYDVIEEMQIHGRVQNQYILEGVSPEHLAITLETLDRVRSNIRKKIVTAVELDVADDEGGPAIGE